MVVYSHALRELGTRARELRLLRALKQEELASRAGVGVMTVRRFEQTGRASLENVLRIAMALGVDEAFDQLFQLPKYRSLDEALVRPAATTRKRVRRSG